LRKERKVMVVKSLNDLRPGQKGVISRVGGKGQAHRRILDMGVISGTPIEVLRVAPMGDPIEIRVKGYNLTLRKEEAVNIQVELTLGAYYDAFKHGFTR